MRIICQSDSNSDGLIRFRTQLYVSHQRFRVTSHEEAVKRCIPLQSSSLKLPCYPRRVRSQAEDEGRARTYMVIGQVFFASAERFSNAFDYKEVIDKVRIDVSRAHFWDITAVSALDKVVLKFRREGTEVEVIGLNEASATLVDKFAVHDKDGADDLLLGH